MPKTSLIIPTLDRQKITFDTLVYLNNQTIKDFEVMIFFISIYISKGKRSIKLYIENII